MTIIILRALANLFDRLCDSEFLAGTAKVFSNFSPGPGPHAGSPRGVVEQRTGESSIIENRTLNGFASATD
jgi:hypothetical protein